MLHFKKEYFYIFFLKTKKQKIVEIRRLLAPERDSIVRLCGGWQVSGKRSLILPYP